MLKQPEFDPYLCVFECAKHGEILEDEVNLIIKQNGPNSLSIVKRCKYCSKTVEPKSEKKDNGVVYVSVRRVDRARYDKAMQRIARQMGQYN